MGYAHGCPPLYIALRVVLLGRDRTTRSVVAAAVAAAAAASIVTFYVYFYESLLSLLGRDATLTGRTKMWGFLIDEMWERPYFGHGFATYSRPAAFVRFWDEFGWSASSTHNSYLEFLLNVGCVVAIYWGFILLRAARANLVSYRDILPADVVKQQIITIMILLSAFSQAGHFFAGSFFWLALVISLFHENNIGRNVRGRRNLQLSTQSQRNVFPTPASFA